jgi:hypothetical protein
METKTFRVVAVTTNANSFGLKQMVLLAQDGTAYKACANSIRLRQRGEDVTVPFDEGEQEYDFTSLGFELPEKMPDAPKDVLDAVIEEVWGKVA